MILKELIIKAVWILVLNLKVFQEYLQNLLSQWVVKNQTHLQSQTLISYQRASCPRWKCNKVTSLVAMLSTLILMMRKLRTIQIRSRVISQVLWLGRKGVALTVLTSFRGNRCVKKITSLLHRVCHWGIKDSVMMKVVLKRISSLLLISRKWGLQAKHSPV